MNPENQNPQLKGKNFFQKFIGIIATILILGSIGFSVAYLGGFIQRCQTPIKFAVGNVDSRFKVNKDQVIESARDAASRWNQKTGSVWYEYDPSSSFKINLVYDDRQAKLDQINAEVTEYNENSSSIEQRSQAIKNKIEKYQQDLADYNSRVAYWNSQGGAPSDIFNQLNLEQNTLESRRLAINNELQYYNLQVDTNNANLNDLSTKIDAQKNKIETQGEYKGDHIDIYTFGNQEELRLVLMHELGHALSIDHAQVSTSIMYYLLADQNQKDPQPTDEDISLIKNKCKIRK